MAIKAFLVGTAAATRKATVLVPEGFSAEEIVVALNSGEAVATNKEVQLGNGNTAVISSHEVDSQSLVWELKDVVTEADAPPHDHDHGEGHSCDGCSCGGHHHHSAVDALKQKLATLNTMAFDFVQAKDIAMARKIATASGAVYKALGGIDCVEGIWTISNRAFICSTEGRHKLAVSYAQRALDMAATVHGTDHTLYAVVLNNTGEVLLDAGRFVEAERYLMDGIGILNLAIEQKSVNLPWAKGAREDALNNLGRIYKSTGRETEAFELMDAIRTHKD